MPDNSSTIVAEALLEALETMAFVALLPVEDTGTSPPDARRVCMQFAGGSTGGIELVAPFGLGRLLRDNILGGAEDDDPDNGPDDALRELMNVTSGILLRQITADKCDVEMGIPTVERYNAPKDWPVFITQPGALVFDADGHPVAIRAWGLEAIAEAA